MAVGRTNQEICKDLFLPLGPVKTHLTNIQAKLSVRNRVEIATWARATGTVSGAERPAWSRRTVSAVRPIRSGHPAEAPECGAAAP